MNTEQSQISSKSVSQDAIDLLMADHQKVKALFAHLDDITKEGASDEEKGALVGKIRDELSVHESVEKANATYPSPCTHPRQSDVWIVG